MNAFIKSAIIAALFAAASFCASAQTAPASTEVASTATVAVTTADSPELAAKKAAAVAYQSKKSFKFVFKSNLNSFNMNMTLLEFEVEPAQGKFRVFGTKSPCEKGGLDATVSINAENDVVVDVVPVALRDCATKFQFVLNPLSKEVKRYNTTADGKKTQSPATYVLAE